MHILKKQYKKTRNSFPRSVFSFLLMFSCLCSASAAFVLLTGVRVRAADALVAFLFFFIDIARGREEYHRKRQYPKHCCHIHNISSFRLFQHDARHFSAPCTDLYGSTFMT